MKTYKTLVEFVENEIPLTFRDAQKLESLCYEFGDDQLLHIPSVSEETKEIFVPAEWTDPYTEGPVTLVMHHASPERYGSDLPIWYETELTLREWRSAVANVTGFTVPNVDTPWTGLSN